MTTRTSAARIDTRDQVDSTSVSADWLAQFPPERQRELRRHLQLAATLGAMTAPQLATLLSVLYRQIAASPINSAADRAFARTVVHLLHQERRQAVATIGAMENLGITTGAKRATRRAE